MANKQSWLDRVISLTWSSGFNLYSNEPEEVVTMTVKHPSMPGTGWSTFRCEYALAAILAESLNLTVISRTDKKCRWEKQA